MENKALSDVASGIFRLRVDDPHMTNSVIVDMHDDTYTALTTVEVRSGAVAVHCRASWENAGEFVIEDLEEDSEDEEDDDEEGEPSEGQEGDEEQDEKEEEEEDDGEDRPDTKTYTVGSGNSITFRATTVMLEPIGLETAEGVYRVQVMRSTD
ncbi:MAG: hypothetical protein ACOY4R_19895 [Pseudomonadota bacterium]